MLRLVSSTIGPVSVAVGANGAAQVVEAYNAGDGVLTLNTPSSSASWLSATVGGPRACTSTTAASTCYPVTVSLNTSALAAGAQTGTITVTGPSTVVDAPQTITVTVNMGGSFPSSITAYVAPGGSTTVPTPTNSDLRWNAATKDGNSWLSMTISGGGSFKFVYPFAVQIAPTSANPVGTYTGTMTISNSAFSGDNKSIPVTMNVTTQPIAQQPQAVNVTLAQGAPAMTQLTAVPVTITNTGQGALTVSGVTASTNSCGSSWLKATATSSGASLTIDPTGLSVGACTGSLAFTTNAVNPLAAVPVTLNVVAKGAAVINYQGVQDNATFVPGDVVSPGDVVVVKGSQLTFQGTSTGSYTAGPAPPLATTVGGATVLVNGTAAPIFYTLYGQIAFQMPVNTAPGIATVQVQRDDGTISSPASVTVVQRAPKILMLGLGGYGAIVNATDGSYPLPSGAYPGLNTHPAKAGDTLVIYAIGLGTTNPPAVTGQPAPSSPLANLIAQPVVQFGTGNLISTPVPGIPFFAGLTPTYAGLYQVNVTVPPGVVTGVITLRLSFPDGTLSNAVQIAMQ